MRAGEYYLSTAPGAFRLTLTGGAGTKQARMQRTQNRLGRTGDFG